MSVSERLAQMGVTLPSIAAPVGSYVPAIKIGSLVMTSGQLPFRGGELTCKGKVPADVSLEEAQEGARYAALNALAAAAQAAGGIDRIVRVVRVAVFVGSSPGFSDQPKVANGASDFLVEVFGDAGRHARAAVGAAELPLGAPVEVELMVEIA
jgi:enamine deaminase RidA (YjgF/YER057c/UK114 family)